MATILVLSSGAIPEVLERHDIEVNTPKIFQRQETTVLNNNQKKKKDFPKGITLFRKLKPKDTLKSVGHW